MFFGELVLFTTFVLSGRFYHRSKKDAVRLSMTTDTDVDCLNIISIWLLTVFGDCMQSAKVKSNVFYAILAHLSRFAHKVSLNRAYSTPIETASVHPSTFFKDLL